jgi:hypothetical protein
MPSASRNGATVMTKFTHSILVVSLLSVFAAASVTGVLADDKKSGSKSSTSQTKGSGGKTAGGTSSGGKTDGGKSSGGTSGPAGAAADAVNGVVGGAVNNAVGGLLNAFGPK